MQKIIQLFHDDLPKGKDNAVTRIRTWVVAATTRSTNHYTITAITLNYFKSFMLTAIIGFSMNNMF